MATLSKRTPDEIRREIAQAREEVASSALALRERVDTLTNFSTWVRKHPLEFVGGAFALGFIVGYRTG